MLWALTPETANLTDALFFYLAHEGSQSKRQDRPNLNASRLAEILVKREDAMLAKMLDRLSQLLGDFHVSALMFDGATVNFKARAKMN